MRTRPIERWQRLTEYVDKQLISFGISQVLSFGPCDGVATLVGTTLNLLLHRLLRCLLLTLLQAYLVQLNIVLGQASGSINRAVAPA